MLSDFISWFSQPNDLILDFFAGSGTTAHAVMELNQEGNGNRKFILVQLPEPTDNSAYPTIVDITRERVRRVNAKLKAEQAAPDLLSEESDEAAPDLGFKAMRLSSSNFKVWDGRADQVADVGATLKLFAEHVLPGRTSEDILYELLLKTGFPLTTPLSSLTLAGKQVFRAAEGALLICLEQALSLEVIEAMVALDPSLILCLDAGFSGQDQLKANAMQTVRAHNRNRQSSMSLKVV
jgi:adenine-specific DNA-methyltransferase